VLSCGISAQAHACRRRNAARHALSPLAQAWVSAALAWISGPNDVR
jgi:hypothetical protein